MAQLETLPNELFMLIFRNLSSPLHIWAFVRASPVGLGHLTSYRQRCISTAIDQLEAWLQTHPQAVMVCRLQHIQEKDSYLEPSKIKSAAWSILNSRPVMDSSIRQSSLRFLSELFILQIHVNEVALTYASQAWNVLQREAEDYEDRINRPHPPHVPFTLSSTELLRIEQGYLEFEVKRHSFHYVRPGLNIGETLASRWRSSIMGRYFPILNSKKGAPYSIFCYLSNEYKLLIDQVHKPNDVQRAKLLAIEGRREEARTIRQMFPNTISGNMLIFYKRTRHQELRYITFLCSYGVSLLESMQRMNTKDREHFILVTYLSIYSPEIELATCRSAESQTYEQGCALQGLRDSLSGRRHDPWMSGMYFWDRSRLLTIYARADVPWSVAVALSARP